METNTLIRGWKEYQTGGRRTRAERDGNQIRGGFLHRDFCLEEDELALSAMETKQTFQWSLASIMEEDELALSAMETISWGSGAGPRSSMEEDELALSAMETLAEELVELLLA